MTTYPSKPRFLSDVDDVCCNYVQGFVSAVIATGVRDIKHDHKFTEWDLSKALGLTDEEDDKVYSLINMPGFASSLHPLPGAVEGLKKVMELADVFFVTSPLKSSPTWSYDRRLWLQKYFGEEQGEKIVSTHEKYTVDGDYFLDDKPEHCAEWHAARPRKMAMLWANGRNATKIPEGVAFVGNWPMIVDMIRLTANTLAKPA